MTEFPPSATRPRLGDRAARALTTEWSRHPGPKSGLLVGAAPDSAALAAMLESVLPGDSLTVVATGPAGAVRNSVGDAGMGRVTVVHSLGEADQADVVVLAEPLTGTAESARAALDAVAKLIAPGGVLAVASVARAAGADGAADELQRQSAFYGVGGDLVLRNRPPVRVHRLRYSLGDPALAVRLGPAYRPSSVPVRRGMHVDSNGIAAAGMLLGLAAVTRLRRPGGRLWLVPALAAAPVAAFFRDPERGVPDDDAAVVAASDGRVLSVEHITDERFGPGRDWLRIAVFLSIFDVHVNRSPVAGRVTDFFVESGGFAAAMSPAAEHNVAAYTVLETTHGPAVVAQRTGLVARRIVQRAPTGSMLARGERFGLIRFGSRTDVYLPAGAARALVAPGDRVVGGASVIAHWTS